MNSVTRVLIAYDQPLLRLAFFQVLEQQSVEIVGEASSAEDAIKLVVAKRPHVVITDVFLNSRLCLDLAIRLKKGAPGLRVLAVSPQSEDVFAERAMRAKFDGYVSTYSSIEDLHSALTKVIRGEHYLSSRIEQRIIMRAMGNPVGLADTNPLEKLTDRELHVFDSLGAGLAPREIASKLELSVKTIESYRERLKDKLGCDTTFGLVRFALECRIIGYNQTQSV